MTDRSAAIVLVTGNAGKLAEARRLSVGLELEAADIDLPEIQALDLRAVALAKAEEAWRLLRRPLIVEETGLELAALNGFPGALVKWMLAAVGAEGIADVALKAGDPRAAARSILIYRHEGGTIESCGATRGELVLPARGSGGFGWDPVFVPEGEERTYGELSGEEKDRISHRGRAWRALIAELDSG